MKIVHISNSDIEGGAARAAWRLHQEMMKFGIETYMFVLKQTIKENTIHTVSRFDKYILSVLRTSINTIFSRFMNKSEWIFSNDLWGINISKFRLVKAADTIIIHWVNGGFMTIKNIEQLLKLKKKTIFVLHDMWALTGGCHYSLECNSYREQSCKHCSQVSSTLRKFIISYFYSKKSTVFHKYNNYSVVAPSVWLKYCAISTPFFAKGSVHRIANPIDRTIFKKIDKNITRKILNISKDVKLLLFAADTGTKNPYKGYKFLEEALLNLNSMNKSKFEFELLIVGMAKNEEIEKISPYKIHFTGRLYDEYSLSLVYNASDVFVTPSLADNLPSTVLESIACGTPAVGFDIGGIPDMIVHKKNGYLARYKDVNDLLEGILYCCENLTNVSSSSNFETDLIIKQYLSLILN
ncbi:MAG: glycosyltransferase [Tannerellaceae bacterium]|jgi:glycosyltransferase involved in cell wall biosynthesis|nr:glycosyltransferase [Tannerellaceae bacterium]